MQWKWKAWLHIPQATYIIDIHIHLELRVVFVYNMVQEEHENMEKPTISRKWYKKNTITWESKPYQENGTRTWGNKQFKNMVQEEHEKTNNIKKMVQEAHEKTEF